MRDWCRKDDFRTGLPNLLEGEDDQFSRYILAPVKACPAPPPAGAKPPLRIALKTTRQRFEFTTEMVRLRGLEPPLPYGN